MVSPTIKMAVEYGVFDLRDLLEDFKEFARLRVKKRADSLILYSGVGEDEQKHARLTWLGAKTWGLSFPRHTGTWEPTPFTGSLGELVGILTRDFPAFLTHY
ncbi:MAG: hypothetical protein FJ109_11165 [Deltaproteobacteria bacterium]|nr:hypothetical protein [Deltaproteobacteria bacterium]